MPNTSASRAVLYVMTVWPDRCFRNINVRRDIVDERVYSNEKTKFEQIYILF